MSDTEEEAPLNKIYRLKVRTLDEIASHKHVPCDACGETTLFGNAVALRCRFVYLEWCVDCAAQYHKELAAINDGRVTV